MAQDAAVGVDTRSTEQSMVARSTETQDTGTSGTVHDPDRQVETGSVGTGRRGRIPTWVSLVALALGGLAIGTTEFASMGVLPLFATDLGVSEPAAGTAISAYALGVVVGAPLITLVGARWPRKRLVLVLAGLVAVTNASSALATDLPWFIGTRFLSGLPHGAYFGTAAVLGAALVPPARRARAIAATMMGLMVANVVGVPAATWLGQNFGWRSAYLAVAVIGVLTVLAVAALVPSVATAGGGSLRRELSALRRPPVWLNLGVIAVGFGGTFAVYSYVAPILTDRSGVPSATVPLVLMVFGVGMTLGNLVGGRLAERAPLTTIAVGMLAGSVVLGAFTLTSTTPVGAAVTLFLLGFVVIAVTPALTTRLIDAAPDGPSLAAASYHSAFNVANALGASLGAVVLAAGLGYAAPAAFGAVLPLLGLVVLAASVVLERRTRAAA